MAQVDIYQNGILRKVVGVCQIPPSLARHTRAWEAFEFYFDFGINSVLAIGEDDSVVWQAGRVGEFIHKSDLSEQRPFSAMIGGTCKWMWILNNQFGFNDGIQLQLSNKGDDIIVQFICAASSLRTFEIKQVYVVDPDEVT